MQIVIVVVDALFLSTLSLRRATFNPLETLVILTISIHALLAESDFLILSPARALSISIHALLAESDQSSSGFYIRCINFYPRSPCGERRIICGYCSK